MRNNHVMHRMVSLFKVAGCQPETQSQEKQSVGLFAGVCLLCVWCVLASRPSIFFNAHCGNVCCAERSPFFRDIILTVGGWNFCIWKQGNSVSMICVVLILFVISFY